MSDIIPPLLSDTPPPPPDINEHEDDEFDDFPGTNNLSYDCDDGYSPPESPLQLPTEHCELDSTPTEIFDFNSNNKENVVANNPLQLDKSKDFHDKRKDLGAELSGNIVHSNLTNGSISSNITENNTHDKHAVLSNNTASFFTENLKKSDESQEFAELKNNEENEIIETNCDIKTTSSQEDSNLSSRDIKHNLKELFLENSVKSTSDDFAEVSSILKTNYTNKCANTLEHNNFENVLVKQCDENQPTVAKTIENVAGGSSISEKKLHLEMALNMDTKHFKELEPKGEQSSILNNQEITLKNAAPGNPADDFGTFTANKVFDESDDFGDFTSLPSEVKSDTTSKIIENELDDDEFSDFFSNRNVEEMVENSKYTKTCVEPPSNNNENIQCEEFPTFSAFSETSNQSNSTDNDDFGDFATSLSLTEEQSEAELYSKLILLNERQALEKSNEIVKEMFPIIEQTRPDFEYKGLEADDKIFNQIKNITDTHALLFQWPKSASQNLLLKALNIDSRNILYGPGWHHSMPRFAANLSLTPLEPIKSEILTPTPARESSSSNATHTTANVEGLQFDMSELGLADPINFSSQSLLLDLEQLVAQLEKPTFKNTSSSHNLSSPADEFENWEAWLQSIPSKANNLTETASTPIVPSVKLDPIIVHSDRSHIQGSKSDLEEKITPSNEHDDFDDFVSYSNPTAHVSPHGHSIILRETHISNKEGTKNDESDIVSWLEPTIVTPELVRKERPFVDADEEFDDFQMVMASEEASGKVAESVNNLIVKPLETLQPQTVGNMELTNSSQNQKSNKTQPIESTPNDDDFGDFTFSLPKDIKKLDSVPLGQPLTPAPLLEPLKPSVLQSNNSTSISWPNPGITDDEISRLEALGYERVQNKQSEPMQKNNRKNSIESVKLEKPPRKSQKSKQNSLEDEEWSDFVSGQNLSPVHKLKSEKERSSTPDLPLSVLNLGSVQPAKQPIPVITPNGLVQTRLSSNRPLNFPNVMQQANRVYVQPQPHQNIQPSIISNQYATQAYAGFGNFVSSSAGSKIYGDNDEWSDFVSHQPTVQKTNQPKPLQNWPSQSNQLSSWINTTPNIITNPAANFDIFGNSKKVSGPVQTRKGTGAPGVSIPDLDFLAPRNRTTQRK